MTDPRGALHQSAFLDEKLRSVASEVFDWSGEERVRQILREEIRADFQRSTDHEFAEKYHSFVGIGEPSDYLSRLVEVDGVRALAAMHFCGRDPDKPFVNIPAMDGPPELWRGIIDKALSAFSVFGAKVCRIQSAGSFPPFEEPNMRVVGDQLVVAERVKEIERRTDTLALVDLRDAEPESALCFVSRMYQHHLGANPALVGRVQEATLEQLQECAERGVLAWWCLDDEIAGLIAARPDSGFGIDGWIVIEEVADPRFIGRGGAAAAQCALARRISCHDENAVLFGTIDFVNIASRKSASKAGRKEIAGWWFVQPAESGSGPDLIW